MSKNVAVFVDVANIFYAAKAAGVDIDYVTLLKSATAGRDFVRAYAYTGLDPENDNQRNFHDFLRRSGYKVVSKDIRKYGDGRIKANLDIELVVDMMRMATHIDIAVVISGDGDFAPAIRAVQQMGVRVEVISFRGNTSSDLIDVADVFMEIAQIARVEKGVRSGRRVASDDDLSMTEVPEKETDLGPRRRRGGRRDERPAARAGAPVASLASVEGGLPGNIIVLPGERLSRAPDMDTNEDFDVELEVVADTQEASGPEAESEEGRRRRRRRGGRGRGRGRRPEGEVAVGEAIAGEAPLADDEELLDKEELAPLPQHSTFGSVWDSQIGVPVSAGQATPYDHDDEDEDEPEIPEYLLAERRAQGRNMNRGRSTNRPGRSAGGYQSAIDRERYGRSGSSAFGSGNRMPDRLRSGPGPQGNQGGQRQGAGRPPRPARMPRPVMSEPRREQERPVASAEPWSEVPPEVQELLRQEQVRRQSAVRPMSGPPVRTEAAVTPVRPAASESPAATRGRRTRTPAVAPSASPIPEPTLATHGSAPTDKAAPAARRRSTRATAAPVKEQAPPEPVAAAPSTPSSAVPARRTRSRASVSAAATSAEAGAQVVDAPGPAAAPAAAAAPARRTRAKAAAPAEAPATAPVTTREATAPKPRRRSTRTTGDTTEG